MKADTREAGAHVKERGLFADAGHLEDEGSRGRGEQHKEIKRGSCKFLSVQMSTVYADNTSDGPVCVILACVILV